MVIIVVLAFALVRLPCREKAIICILQVCTSLWQYNDATDNRDGDVDDHVDDDECDRRSACIVNSAPFLAATAVISR